MLSKYSFFPVSVSLLLGLAWWSFQIGSFEFYNRLHSNAPKQGINRFMSRRDLIEVLDRAVAYQHYYRSVFGRFSENLDGVGFQIPSNVTDHYDVRVVEATLDRLVIHAYGKEQSLAYRQADKKQEDMASVDQDFHLETNFQLPPPRVEYLKRHALRHLSQMRSAPKGQIVADEGIFKGYFSYSIEQNPDSPHSKGQSERVLAALGEQVPVKGLRLELKDHDRSESEVDLLESRDSVQEMSPLQDEVQLAQTIFRGEMGRYANHWAELSQIAHFPNRFERADSSIPLERRDSPAQWVNPQSEERLLNREISSQLEKLPPRTSVRGYPLQSSDPLSQLSQSNPSSPSDPRELRKSKVGKPLQFEPIAPVKAYRQ